jgi:tRNA-splicing ligase RtcB
MTESSYNVIKPETGVPIKAWTRGVPLENAARNQLLNVAQLVDVVHTLRQVVCVKG